MKGSCHCGRTTYRVDVASFDDVAYCHCTACRRTTGGTHVTWATVPLDRFAWTGTKPAEYRSSEHASRFFCATCGAQIAFVSSRFPGEMDLTVTTLEFPENAPPERHTWVASKLPWVHIADGLPQERHETPRRER
jgi:hypothetical protein